MATVDVGDAPGACAAERRLRAHHVADVVHGHTQRRRRTGDGVDRVRAVDGRGMPPRACAGRGSGGDDFPVVFADDAHRRRRAGNARGDRPQTAYLSAERRPGPLTGAARGVGREEGLRQAVRGDAQLRRFRAERARDAGRVVGVDERDRPCRGAARRIGRRDDIAVGAVDRDAQTGGRTRDARQFMGRVDVRRPRPRQRRCRRGGACVQKRAEQRGAQRRDTQHGDREGARAVQPRSLAGAPRRHSPNRVLIHGPGVYGPGAPRANAGFRNPRTSAR